jgi:hypothetical protein
MTIFINHPLYVDYLYFQCETGVIQYPQLKWMVRFLCSFDIVLLIVPNVGYAFFILGASYGF